MKRFSVCLVLAAIILLYGCGGGGGDGASDTSDSGTNTDTGIYIKGLWWGTFTNFFLGNPYHDTMLETMVMRVSQPDLTISGTVALSTGARSTMQGTVNGFFISAKLTGMSPCSGEYDLYGSSSGQTISGGLDGYDCYSMLNEKPFDLEPIESIQTSSAHKAVGTWWGSGDVWHVLLEVSNTAGQWDGRVIMIKIPDRNADDYSDWNVHAEFKRIDADICDPIFESGSVTEIETCSLSGDIEMSDLRITLNRIDAKTLSLSYEYFDGASIVMSEDPTNLSLIDF